MKTSPTKMFLIAAVGLGCALAPAVYAQATGGSTDKSSQKAPAKKSTAPADKKVTRTDDAPAEGKTANKAADKKVTKTDDAPAEGRKGKGVIK